MTQPPSYPAPDEPSAPYRTGVFAAPGQANPTVNFTGYPPPPGPAEPEQPPRSRRTLVITLIVLAVVLVCGSGGTAAYLLANRIDEPGQATPAAAVDGFLSAIFHDKSADKAVTYVCSTARNKPTLTTKINELRSYQQGYPTSLFSWSTPVIQSQNSDTATVTVTIRFASSDERIAEKKLTFLTVNESGWRVCEVRDTG